MNNDFGIVSRVYVLPDEQGRVTRIEGEEQSPSITGHDVNNINMGELTNGTNTEK